MIDPHHFAPWVSDEAKAMFAAELAMPPPAASDIATLRAHYDAFNRRHLATALEHYAVEIVPGEIAGVRVDVVTPVEGVSDQRTLLCLHGGAFMWGRGAGALLEAVPVAATAKMRVIAVEYALAPEQVFPVAVEQVVAVYRALCERQPNTSIGIYGCSAGAALTAQVVARLIVDQQPVPGAIAMLCAAGLPIDGDSAASAGPFMGVPDQPAVSFADMPYFASADLNDPRLFPGEHPAMLAHFPPSLLVSGTRDFAASAVSVMHRRLLGAGAQADLMLFDGMWHAHHMTTALPESRETFAALARHFDRNLA